MRRRSQSGNALLYILIAIVLIGVLTIALRDSGGLEGGVDRERLQTKVSGLLRQSGEMAAGIDLLLQNGVSEGDVRVAYPGADATYYGSISSTPQNQLFSAQGGQTLYQAPDPSLGGANSWGFNGDRAMPQVGSDKADLVANVARLNLKTCTEINRQIGLTSTPATSCDTASTGFQGAFSSTPINFAIGAFSTLPAPRFCVKCTDRNYNGTSEYIYFTTLMAR